MIKIAIVKLLFPEVGNWPWFGTIRVSLRNGSVVVVCVCNSWITVRVKTRALNHVIFTFKSVWGNVRICRGSRGPRCFATFLFSICFLISILTRSICFFLFFFFISTVTEKTSKSVWEQVLQIAHLRAIVDATRTYSRAICYFVLAIEPVKVQTIYMYI